MLRMKNTGPAAVVSALACWLVLSNPGYGAGDQSEVVNTEIGTLTCSYDNSRESAGEGKLPVTCDYRPVSGPIATFQGIVTRPASSATQGLEKVFLWTVFAPDFDVAVGDLSGRYSGVMDTEDSGEADYPGSLTGGAGTEIELRPMTGEAYEKAEPAIIVLEIELKAVKA